MALDTELITDFSLLLEEELELDEELEELLFDEELLLELDELLLDEELLLELDDELELLLDSAVSGFFVYVLTSSALTAYDGYTRIGN